MGVNPLVRALRNSVLKGAAGQRPADALARGVQAAGHVGASATEFLRVRRDPAEIAIRRRKAAVRRANVWGAGVVVGVAGGAALAVAVADAGITASEIFSFIIVAALVIWCTLGLVRSVVDLRRRSRAVAALPPPQPARGPVAGAIRADIGRLDSYSDGLRQLVSMLAIDTGHSGAALRRDVITSADGAERQLRRQAQEYTGVRKAMTGAPAAARPALNTTADELAGRIRAGVAEYGRLVSAATTAVVASAQLKTVLTDLEGPIDRLQALAMGMREIAGHARPPDPTASSA